MLAEADFKSSSETFVFVSARPQFLINKRFPPLPFSILLITHNHLTPPHHCKRILIVSSSIDLSLISIPYGDLVKLL